MEMLRISGREYPARPPSDGRVGDRLRRLLLITSALEYASGRCSEPERKLYKSILEVRAHAENLVDQVRGEKLGDPQLSDLMSAAHEP